MHPPGQVDTGPSCHDVAAETPRGTIASGADLAPFRGSGEEVASLSRGSNRKLGQFRLARAVHYGITSDPSKEETMSADEADKTLKQDLEDTRNDLRRAADEIKLKLHLAGMDAKDAWEEVQPRLADFEQRFDAKAGEVSDELKALGNDIMKRLQNIKSKLKIE